MVNWLVIGIGYITRKRVLPAILAEPRSRLHAVLTRDPRKAEAYRLVLATARGVGSTLRDEGYLHKRILLAGHPKLHPLRYEVVLELPEKSCRLNWSMQH